MVVAAQEAVLVAGPLLGRAVRLHQQHVGIGQDFGAVGLEAIEGAGGGEAFELTTVHRPRWRPAEHVVEAGERPVRLTLGDELLHRLLADVADAGERIAHCIALVGLLDGELGLRMVDVRAFDGDATPAHVVDEDRELFRLVHVEAHRGGVELVRVMRLEPGGVVRQQRIGGGVRLVEAVAGELVDQVEQLVRLLGLDARFALAAVDEALALRVHLGLDLLAHRAAQQVGVAERVARQDLRGLHHLFLIDEDAVGLGKDAFELGVRVLDAFEPVLAPAEQRDVVHRAWPIERDERDDVAEIGRLHRRQRAPHAFGFELEHADGVAALEQFIDLFVLPRERRQVDLDLPALQQVDRLAQHRQRLEAQEVEFDEAGILDELHVELRHRHVRARIAVERDELGQRAVADHHAGRVGRAVARQAFQLHGEVDQPLDLGIDVVLALEFGYAVERARQGPGIGRVVGHHLGEPVDLAVAHLQDAPGVAQHRARLELAEGDDLSDVIVPVLLLDIADHLAAAGFAEVDVEVGHRHALGIEEAFEQQAQPDRIEIGDRQRPGDEAARARTAARSDRDALVLRPLDEVGHDQEVAAEAHAVDDRNLELEAVAVFLELIPDAAQPELVESRAPGFVRAPEGFGQLRLVGIGIIGCEASREAGSRILRHHPRLALLVAGEAGEDRLALGRRKGAALGDDQRVGERLGQVGEQFLHHRDRLDPGLGRGARTLGRVDVRRVGDAQHRVVRGVEVAFGEIGRVGRHQRQVARIGEVDQRLFRRFLDRVVAPGDLDVEPVAEQRPQPIGIGAGRVMPRLGQEPRQRTLARTGQRDQAVGMAFEVCQQHVRITFERTIQVRAADEMAEVVPAGLVLRIERQPVDRAAILTGYRQRRADNRLHARVAATAGEGDRAVEAVAVGDGDRREAALLGQLGDRFRIDRPFEHGIARKHAKRHERSVRHAPTLAASATGDQAVRHGSRAQLGEIAAKLAF